MIGKCRKVAKQQREEQTEPRRQGVEQEASQRATDGLQPDRSDAEEFQAASREGGKVPGGGGALRVGQGSANAWSGILLVCMNI